MSASHSNPNTPADILIVGGGPAGASAAIALARQGRSVTLVEKAAGTQEKVCGEFVSGESEQYLRMLGVDIVQLGAIAVGRVRVAAHKLIAEDDLPFRAWSLRRSVLDEALLRRAMDEGATLLRSSPVESVAFEHEVWRARLADGNHLACKDLFLATGKHDLRGWPREGGAQNGLVAFKIHLKLTHDQAKELHEVIELIVFRGGYAGLQLIGTDSANISLLLKKATLKRIGHQWPDVLNYLKESSGYLKQRLQGAFALTERPLALSAIPYGFQRKTVPPRLWGLGDQAAVIPSFTGDGISIALHSAMMAAHSYQIGRGSETFQSNLASQLRSQVSLATWISRALVAAPSLTHLLRIYPSLIAHIAHRTRVADRYTEAITSVA